MDKHRFTNICKNCNKVFAVSPSKQKRPYCSKKCYAESRKKGFYPAYWLGKRRTTESIKKQSETMKKKLTVGELKIWNTNKKLSKEHRLKISRAIKGKMVGEKHPNWTGGTPYVHDKSNGYLVQWSENGRMYQHRKVMEEYLGRPLNSEEVIHHIDGNTSNNNIENLNLFKNKKEHMSYHASLKNTFVNQYGTFPRKNKTTP